MLIHVDTLYNTIIYYIYNYIYIYYTLYYIRIYIYISVHIRSYLEDFLKTTILLKVIFWYWHPFSKPLVLSQSHVLLVERTVLLIVVLFGSPIWSPELKQWCESWGNHQGSSKIAPFQESIKKSRKSGVKKSIFDFGFLVVAFHEISLLKLCETTSVTPTSELPNSFRPNHWTMSKLWRNRRPPLYDISSDLMFLRGPLIVA